MKYEVYKTRDGLLIPVVFPEGVDNIQIKIEGAVKVSEGKARNTASYGIVPTSMRKQEFPVRNNIWRDRELLGALSFDYNRFAYVDHNNEIAPPLLPNNAANNE